MSGCLAQDESYWLDMPDKRALSFWFPLCDARVENGCMWFVPGSHQGELRPHRPVRPGHHLKEPITARILEETWRRPTLKFNSRVPTVQDLVVRQMTEAVEAGEGVACPVAAGGCTVHTGRTLHYTGGNTTRQPRRAYIVNCRPAAMVEWERQHGFDHGRAGLESITQQPEQAAIL